MAMILSQKHGTVSDTFKVTQLIHAVDSTGCFAKNTCEGVSILAEGYPF